ncbi:MAG: PKD domain-containing protein [Flavobacteriales bacterium]|jgi:gliding motility-associated-like protein|nr:PKD domain-containing protein [Flavobacteriales bacterium]
MFKKILIFLCLFSISYVLKAQSGTDFWLAPPEVTSGHVTDNPVMLRIATGANPATVTISQPANPGFNGGTPIVLTMAANAATTVDLSAELNNLETRPSNTVLNTGLHISSTQKITCYYEINTGFNPDIYALKGDNGLGTEFYTPFQSKWRNGNYSPTPYTSFDIVATQNNTTILIYPRVPLDGGHPALTSYTITLNRGQTYSGSVTSTSGIDNPAGTAIVSDKPIAVSTKDDSVWPQPAGCRDLVGDQLVPTNIVGTDYIVQRGGLTVPESAFITATRNNCIVTVAGTYVTTLFAGETYEVPITAQATYINCSEPAYCFHISGFGCEVGGALLPPLNCAGSDQVNFVRSTTEFFGLNILVPTGSQGNFALNGNTTLIPAGAFSPVPGTGGAWMEAQISYNTTDIPINTNMLITNTSDAFAVGIINGGASSGCRFGYFSEFAAKIDISAGVDQTVCANDSATLNGSVAGGSTTGIWTGGSGQFLPSATALNATYVPSPADISLGTIILTLTSTGNCTPVDDQMQLSFSPAPVANAGSDVSVCENNPAVSLNGSVTIAASGVWSGGAGTYSPNSSSLTTSYTPTAAEINAGTLVMTLTTTGNGVCNAETDNVIVTFTPSPTVDAGVNQTVCSNNAQVNLAGSRTLATGVIWSGAGTFSPNVNALNPNYTPSAAEILSGNTVLTLTTTGNGNCNAVSDVVTLNFTPSPTVNASTDQTVCSNNSAVTLNGSTTVATGGQWTGGLGVFLPNNNTLNATYNPTSAEIANGSLNLTLTTTGNGNCNAETDNMTINFTPSPTVEAGAAQTVCSSSPAVTLGGSVTVATGGFWSGGAGTFSPNAADLNATYTPSAAEITTGSVQLMLTTTGNGNCNPVSDSVMITITPTPTVNAGPNQTSCANNSAVNLGGVITTATGGIWSGGTGNFVSSNTDINAVYTPSNAEVTAGSVNLTLTSTGNGNCPAITDDILITIIPAPVADAGLDQTACSNNASINLVGSVNGASGGQWSGGLGAFSPSNNALNATYTPNATELANGSATITLTTTGNGVCNAESDNMLITFTPAPTVDAGLDITSCENNPQVTLNGNVTIATGGQWIGGTGSFTPSNTDLSATYTPSTSEITNGTALLILQSTGNANCNMESDSVVITIDPSPVVAAGVDQTICVNNLNVVLSGSVSGITNTGNWTTSGSGFFVPNSTALNANYVPSAADSIAGSVMLTLTSTNNVACTPVSDSMLVTILPAGIANAGSDVTVCANNSTINLAGSVSGGASTGVWTTNGTGVFVPDNQTLNANYIPSPADAALGSVTLTLTANSCDADTDNITVTITPAPIVAAGQDVTVCANSLTIPLNGSVSGATTTGVWTTSGTGTFNPSNTDLNASYIASSQDSLNQTITLVLSATSIGQCAPETDTMVINIFPTGTADGGADQVLCENNGNVQLTGVIGGGATIGEWNSSGSGTFVPNINDMNAVYVPSAADLILGSVNISLSATNSCNNASDVIGVTYTPAPTVNAGADTSVCGTNAVIALSGNIIGAVGGEWSTNGTGVFSPNIQSLNAIYSASSQDVANGGVWIYLTSIGNGDCNAVVDSMRLTITTGINVNAGVDQTVCSTSSFTVLQGVVSNGSTTGVWSTLGSGTFTPSTTSLTTEYHFGAGDLVNGSVDLVLTSTNNGSCIAETDTMTINFGSNAYASAGNDFFMCGSEPSTAPLNGYVSGGATQGQWSTLGTGSFSSLTDFNAVYTPSVTDFANGFFELVLTTTDHGSCLEGVDTVMVTIEAVPSANAGVNIQACTTSDSIPLSGSVSNVSGGQWSTGGTGTFHPNDTTLNAVYVPSIADLGSGTIQVYLTTIGSQICGSDMDSITIEFADPLTVDFANSDGCENNFMSFYDSTIVHFGSISEWNWDFGDGGTSQSPNPIHLYTNSGAYDVVLEVVSNLGCEYTLTQSVVVQGSPIANFSLPTGDVIVGQEVGYSDLSVGGVSWYWTFGDGFGNSTDQNPTYTYATEGDYNVLQTVTNAFGCSDTALLTLTVLPEEEPYYPPVVPSGFSPNGDGENDVLYVRGGPFDSVILRVYNNWGNLIFESNDVNVGWDGTHNGKDQPKGDYVYSAIVIGLDGKEYIKKGSVSIIR